MARFLLRITIVGLVLGAGLRAQTVELTAEGGSGWLSVEARDVPLREVFLAFAASQGVPLEIAPEVFQRVAKEPVDLHLSKMPPLELIHCLGGAYGLDVELGKKLLSIRDLPKADDESRQPWLRMQTLWAVKRLLLIPGDPVAGEALLMAGALHRSAAEHRDAALMLRRFIALLPGDVRGAKARLWAAASSAAIGAREQARSMVRDLEQRFPDADEVFRGQLLLAEIDRAEGNQARTLMRISRILSRKTKDRTHALALLFKAETWYLFGNAESAVATIEGFDGELERLHPDLGEQLAYARGKCLLARGELPAALLSLRLALMSDPRIERRQLAALAMSEAYERMGDPVTALVTLRTARRFEVGADLEIRRLVQEARLLRRHGVKEEAINRLNETVALGSDFERSKQRDEILEMLAEMLLGAERYEQARALFARFRSIAERSSWAALMMARCDFGAGEHKRALALLDDLTKDERAELDKMVVARLRGECFLALGQYQKASRAFADLGEKGQ